MPTTRLEQPAYWSIGRLRQDLERSVLRQDLVAEEQRRPIVPEEAGGVVQAVLFDASAQVGPARPAAPADIMLPVIPPKLESAEGTTTAVPYAQDAVAAKQLLDLPFITYGDLFHGWTLHEETRLLPGSPASGFSWVCRRHWALFSPVSTQRLTVFTCYLPIAGPIAAVFSHH
jgi:hypothetical protein